MSEPGDGDAPMSREADAVVAASVGPATEHAPSGIGHESRDVRIRPIALAFTGLLVIGILTQLLMYVLLQGFTLRDERAGEPASPLAAAYGRQAPPAPRLQVAPAADLSRLRAREEALLHDYAWADRDAGVVRIPIERAIELLAARGLPSAAATPHVGTAAGDRGMPAAEGTAP